MAKRTMKKKTAGTKRKKSERYNITDLSRMSESGKSSNRFSSDIGVPQEIGNLGMKVSKTNVNKIPFNNYTIKGIETPYRRL